MLGAENNGDALDVQTDRNVLLTECVTRSESANSPKPKRSKPERSAPNEADKCEWRPARQTKLNRHTITAAHPKLAEVIREESDTQY